MPHFVFIACCLLSYLTLCTTVAAEDKNVLIIFVDDLRPELNCYGADNIHSPSIDQLASEGLLFERAYCQQAICAPSRASMLSGQYPDSLGIYDLFSPLRRTLPEVISMPSYFQQRGYETAAFGKVYHHHSDDKKYWSQLPDVEGEKYADKAVLKNIAKQTRDAKAKGLKGLEVFRAIKGPATENADVADEVYRDGAVAQQAIGALRRVQDKPFFMCVGFAKPHLPFAAPKRYWDLYDRDQFVVPNRKLPQGTPKIAVTKWGELRAYQGMPKQGPLTDAMAQELMHGYAASVSFADAQVGKVLAELDTLGLREKTIVVLWGDHGFKLGDYGLWCKHTNLELDTRVPLIVSAPGFAKNARCDSLVEMVDVFPTLVELTQGEMPKSCDGRSFKSVLANPDQPFRDFALSQYPRGKRMGYSLRNGSWRFTEWVDSKTHEVVARELYDHRETQRPTENVAGDAANAERVAELSKQLGAVRRSKSRNK